MNREINFPLTINLGQILTIVTFLLSLAGVVITQAKFQERTEIWIQRSEEARNTYIPRLEAQGKLVDAHEGRLNNIAEATIDLRKQTGDALAELRKSTEEIRKSLVDIQVTLARLQDGKPNERMKQ